MKGALLFLINSIFVKSILSAILAFLGAFWAKTDAYVPLSAKFFEFATRVTLLILGIHFVYEMQIYFVARDLLLNSSFLEDFTPYPGG